MTMSSSDDPTLPHDVVVEILKRLPVESLLRFRCVSRSWRSTIDDPRFVALHLNHSALHASNWYLLCLDCSDPVQRLCSLFSNESLTLASRSQIEIPFDLPNRYGTVGSCNGLICVTEISRIGYGQTMYLWNLFTRKHKAVRQSGLEDQVFPVEPHIVVGFGFDARSNDYKIVRIFYVLDYDGRCYRGTKPQVEIYSLSTDSWRSLECEVPAVTYARPTVFLNGNLHWFALKFSHLGDEGVFSSIVSFDVASEVFDEMALPEENFQVDSDGLEVYVAVLNDLLAVFISRGEAVGHRELHSVCSVWVMRDYGVPESWTKLYTFEASGLITRFDGFAWNGELLMHIDDGERVSWNPITGQFADLPLRTLSCLVPIVKSLISP